MSERSLGRKKWTGSIKLDEKEACSVGKGRIQGGGLQRIKRM